MPSIPAKAGSHVPPDLLQGSLRVRPGLRGDDDAAQAVGYRNTASTAAAIRNKRASPMVSPISMRPTGASSGR